jgi:YfiH family protein
MKDESRRREAAKILGLSAPLTLKQVHGITIHDANPENAGLEGDGWLLSRRGLTVGVYAADCVPLFLWEESGKAAGVFHAGWRGTAKGMALAAVAAFRDRLSIPASRLCAATGAHIGPCCYKVGEELKKGFPESSFVARDGALWLDLALETRRQLLEAGLSPEKIGPAAPCTSSNPNDYFSFRRDKQDARMLAFVSLP